MKTRNFIILFLSVIFVINLNASGITIKAKYEIFKDSGKSTRGFGEIRCILTDGLGFMIGLYDEDINHLTPVLHSNKNSDIYKPLDLYAYSIKVNDKIYDIFHLPNKFCVTAYENNNYLIMQGFYGKIVFSMDKEGCTELAKMIKEAVSKGNFKYHPSTDVESRMEELKKDGFWIGYIYPDIDIDDLWNIFTPFLRY